jgi:hypothetical protein
MKLKYDITNSPEANYKVKASEHKDTTIERLQKIRKWQFMCNGSMAKLIPLT